MASRTRLVVLTSPHNPTGTLADPDALQEIGRLSVLAFDHLDSLIARTRSLLDINTPLVLAFLRSRRDPTFVEPRGGTVVFPRLDGVDDTSRFAERLLRERDTAIVPGRFFQAPRHVRLWFSGETALLRLGSEA